MPLTLLQGGATVCNEIVGYNSTGDPIRCNGQGYQYTDYVEQNGHWRKRVVVCRKCKGSGKR